MLIYTQKIEAVCSCRMLVRIHKSTRHYNAIDQHRCLHPGENRTNVVLNVEGVVGYIYKTGVGGRGNNMVPERKEGGNKQAYKDNKDYAIDMSDGDEAIR